MKLHTACTDRRPLLTVAAAILLTVCSACGPHRAQLANGSLNCGGGEQVFDDPAVAPVRDSVTVGGPAVVAQFHWTALAAPVSAGFWGTDDRTAGATLDSVGRARVIVPQAGLYTLHTRVLGSIPRVDVLSIPRDSTVWVRIGLARATLHYVCVTVASAPARRHL